MAKIKIADLEPQNLEDIVGGKVQMQDFHFVMRTATELPAVQTPERNFYVDLTSVI
ncbi:MAG: hypothetical protein HY319_05420 [Armatimonadetes bacterium]|nr:hypothetical protein [Armatimonadota bacterium]